MSGLKDYAACALILFALFVLPGTAEALCTWAGFGDEAASAAKGPWGGDL